MANRGWLRFDSPVNSAASVIVIGMIVFGLWFALAAISPSFPRFPFSSAGTAGGGQVQVVQQPPTTGSGSNQIPQCGNQLPVAQLVAYYNDPNNNNLYTKVATTASVYIAGQPTALSTVTTSTSGINQTTSGQLSCGSSVREIAGDSGVTYYNVQTPDFQINNAVMYPANGGLGLAVIPGGNATVYFQTPTSLFGSTIAYNWTADGKGLAGVSDGSVQIKVQAPSAPARFGDLGYAVCYRFNSANFTTVRANGGTQVSISHVKATSSLDTVQCWEFPSLPGGQTFQTGMYLKGAAAGPTDGALIDVVLVSKTNQIYNGYLIPQENSAAMASGAITQPSNGYDQINDPNAAIGRSDITISSAINVTTG